MTRLLNLLPQDYTAVYPDGSPHVTLAATGKVAHVIHSQLTPMSPIRIGDTEIPCVSYGGEPDGILGLPPTSCHDPILVTAQVADAMRLLGMSYPAGVYTPQHLVYKDGKLLGSPGLIYHRDISRE